MNKINKFNTPLTLFASCCAVVVLSFVWCGLTVMIPFISKDLGGSIGEAQWTINIYGIVGTSTLIIWGRFADRYGRKKIFVLGVLFQIISLLISSRAHSMNIIIAMQALMGLAAGIVLPVSQAVISNVLPKDKVSHAIGLWAFSAGLSCAVAPFLSSIILHYLGWRYMFYIPCALLLLAFLLIIICCPETRLEKMSDKNDWLGLIFLILCISCFVTGVNQVHDWNLKIIYCLFILSLVCLLLFIITEYKVSYPILKLDLFINKNFTFSCCIVFFLFVCLWSQMFNLPQFLHKTMHYSPLKVGFAMLFVAMPVFLFQYFSPKLQQSLGSSKLCLTGFLFLFLSIILQVFVSKNTSYIYILLITFSFGLAWYFIWSPSNVAALSGFPHEHHGLVAGTFVTLQELGGTLGLSIYVTLYLTFSNSNISGSYKGFSDMMICMLVPCFLGFICSFFLESKN